MKINRNKIRFYTWVVKEFFIDENKYSINAVKEHYKKTAINAFETWHNYNVEVKKIYSFSITTFFAILMATGIFELNNENFNLSSAPLMSSVIFHTFFSLIFVHVHNKKQKAGISFLIAKRTSLYYRTRFNEMINDKYEFKAINSYLFRENYLLKIFNFSILIIYCAVTTVPFIKLDFENGFRFVGWKFVLTLILFIISLMAITRISRNEYKLVHLKISKEMNRHFKKNIKW